MQQPISAGEDFDKGAEVHNPVHRADIRLANFGLGSQPADASDRSFSGGAVGGGNRNRAIVIYVYLRAGLFNQCPNHLTAWSDDVANLIRIDLDLDDSWRQ